MIPHVKFHKRDSITVPAWMVMATGKRPGTLGVL